MNLATIVEGHPDDSTALISGPGKVTYGQLRADAARVRAALHELGVGPGERVVLSLGNVAVFPAVYLGVLGVGAVAVPVDPTQPAAALETEIDLVRPSLVVVGAASGPDSDQADQAAEGRAVQVVGADDLLGEKDPAGEVPIVERAADDVAVLIFTAGTIGPPRAAMLTHGSIHSNMEQVQDHPGRALVPGDVSYGVLPFFHVFGLNVVLGLSLLAGASVLIVERFDAAQALQDIPRHRVTVLAGAPPLFAALTAAGAPAAGPGPDPGPELTSVRLAVSGASALPPEVGEGFEERFGLPLWQGYGLTEASPVVTSSVIGGMSKPGSVGVPIPGVELRLVDESGQDALVGDPGELWARGPNVFAGYWEDPEATAAVLTRDGWLRTGDVGVVDDDEYVYLVDRAKDLIIVSGFNLYPAEVEHVLTSHPDVVEAAAVGAPDHRTGEAVHAYVVLEAAAARNRSAAEVEAELSAWCRARLAGYKCPSVIRVVEGLPHGLAGKLLRRALKEGTVAPL